MTEFSIESRKLEAFDVAQMHGVMGLRHLSAAHEKCRRWEAVRAEIESTPPDERWKHSAAAVTEKPLLEKDIAQHLFAAVILFQASMESILNMTAGMDMRVEKAVDNNGTFAAQWRAALGNVGESTTAFDRYKNEIYDDYRNPLAHLGDDDDVQKVNDITFRQVYCGTRAGWWAYDSLLHGIGESGGDTEQSWAHLCAIVGLRDDLYPDDDLVAESDD